MIILAHRVRLLLTPGLINFGPPSYASTDTWSPKVLDLQNCKNYKLRFETKLYNLAHRFMLVLTHGRINFGPTNYRHLVSQEEAKIRLPLLGIVNYIESWREHKTEFFVIRFLKIFNIILIKIIQSLWQSDYNKKKFYNATSPASLCLCLQKYWISGSAKIKR